MSRKIAPNLTEWIESADRHGLEFHKPMKRELRALLAVARAAEEIAETIRICSVFCESCGYDNPLEGMDGSDRLNRALARLDRKPRGRSGSAGERR